MTRARGGFTLLEVVIAVTILAILTALTAQTIQRSLQMKKKIQTDIDRESQVRNAMRLIEKDINSAFNYRDLNYEMQEDIKKQQAQAGQPAGAPPPVVDPNAPGSAPPKKLTHFLGGENQLDFTSLNHVRMMKDAQESDQEEVGYFLESCKSRLDDKITTQCLKRRTSPLIDDDVSKGGASITLLEYVTQFKLRYLGKGKDEWTSTWRTDEKGDEVTKDKFPQAVEVTLVTNTPVGKDQQGKDYGLTSVFAIQFPNNKPEKKNDQAQGQPAQPGQPAQK